MPADPQPVRPKLAWQPLQPARLDDRERVRVDSVPATVPIGGQGPA